MLYSSFATSIQNTVTRNVTNTISFSHKTRKLKSLHWLPVYTFILSVLLHSALFYYLASRNSLLAYALFLMLHHLSGIIHRILFVLQSLTCRLIEKKPLKYN